MASSHSSINIVEQDNYQEVDESRSNVQRFLLSLRSELLLPFQPIQSDIVGEILLKLIGIEESPKSSYFASSGSEGRILLCYEMPSEFSSFISSAINAHFFNLHAIDVPTKNKFQIRVELDLDVFRRGCLPLIALYLKDHPEMVDKHQRLFCRSIKNLTTFFSTQYINKECDQSRILINLILQVLKENPEITQHISVALNAQQPFPTVLEDMIFDYLNLNKKVESIDGIPIWEKSESPVSGLAESTLDATLPLYVNLPLIQAEQIKAYFNKIYSGSAKIFTVEEYELRLNKKILRKQKNNLVIEVDKRTLNNPGFISILSDKFKSLSLKEQNNYRMTEKNFISIEKCLEDLENTTIAIMNDENFKHDASVIKLTCAIDALIDFVKTAGGVDDEALLARGLFKNVIAFLTECEIKFSAKFAATRRTFFSSKQNRCLENNGWLKYNNQLKYKLDPIDELLLRATGNWADRPHVLRGRVVVQGN